MNQQALIIFIPLYIAVKLANGFWASARIKTAKDFTLAGRSLSTSIVGVTFLQTGSSVILMKHLLILQFIAHLQLYFNGAWSFNQIRHFNKSKKSIIL